MNMQDYKHAVDRIEIDPSVRREVLQIGADTAAKTKKPIFRITHGTAGVAVAAALLVANGALGYAFLSTRDAVENSRAANPSADDGAPAYVQYFREYYYDNGFGPDNTANFAGWGADCDQVFEIDKQTLTVKAMAYDGFQYKYLYTVSDRKGINLTGYPVARMDIIPDQDLMHAKLLSGGEYADGRWQEMKDYVRALPTVKYTDLHIWDHEPGITRLGYVSLTSRVGAPLSAPALLAYAYQLDYDGDGNVTGAHYTDAQEVQGDLPFVNPAVYTLSQDVNIIGYPMHYASVTPFSIVLSDASMEERTAAMQEGCTAKKSHEICSDSRENPELFVLHTNGVIDQPEMSYCHDLLYGDYSELYTVETASGKEINTVYLDFTAPQDISDYRALCINGTILALNEHDSMDEIRHSFAQSMAASSENLLAGFTEEERTKEFDFGTVRLDAARPCNIGVQIDYTVRLNDTVAPDSGSAYGYDRVFAELSLAGFDEAGASGSVGLKRFSSETPYTEGTWEDGAYHLSDTFYVPDHSIPLENMLTEIRLRSVKVDGFAENETERDTKLDQPDIFDTNTQPLGYFNYTYPAAMSDIEAEYVPDDGAVQGETEPDIDAFPEVIKPFSELTRDELVRQMDFGTVRIDRVYRLSTGKVYMDYSFKMAREGSPQWITCMILPRGYTDDWDYLDLLSSHIDENGYGASDSSSDQSVAEHPDETGWWHFKMELGATLDDVPEGITVELRLLFLQIGGTVQDTTPPEGTERGDMYGLGWFKLDV